MDELLSLLRDFRGVRSAGAQNELHTVVEKRCGLDQMSDTLLTGDAADERDHRARRVNAELLQDRPAVLFLGLFPRRARVPQLGVDTVQDNVDLVGGDTRVGIQDGVLHARGNSNDSVCVLHSIALGPAGNVVTAAKLLALPWAVRLQ